MRRFGGKIIEIAVFVSLKEIVKIAVIGDVEQVPIIQPRPLHGPVADVEPQRAHQMQPTAGGSTGPGNVPGVHRDLWFHQNDIQHDILRLAPDKLSL